MTKDDINSILEAARQDFDGKNIIAFIGKTNYGKTVVSTLLFDALTTEFLKKYKKKFHVTVLDGHEEIDRSHRRIFAKGRFPPATLPNMDSKLTIKITSREPLGSNVEYMLRDASGEDIQEILQERYDSPEELVETVLTKYKSPSDQYGPLSYLLFAKTYVILINSEESKEWRTEQVRYSQIISSIYDMKDNIDETVDETIKNPIALVFTKTDKWVVSNEKSNTSNEKSNTSNEKSNTSNEKSNTSNEKSNTSNYNLLEDLPLLESCLESTHSGKLEIFKFSIDGVQKATTEETKEIIEEEEEERNRLNDELTMKKSDEAEKERRVRINQRASSAMNKARHVATSEGQPPEEIERRARAAEKSERVIAEAENKFEILKNKSIELGNISKTRHKITLPVKYSQREYIRFISWLINKTS